MVLLSSFGLICMQSWKTHSPEAACLHGIKEASLQKIGIGACNCSSILMTIKREKCRLHLPDLKFSSLLSACCYNLIEISGVEDDNCCGVAKLAYRGTL